MVNLGAKYKNRFGPYLKRTGCLNLNNLVLHLSTMKVTLASTAVFSYAGLIPACLYGYLWWAGQGGTITISFLELVSSNISVKF